MRDGLRPAEDGVVKRAVSELPEMSDEAFDAGRAKLLARMGRTAAEPAAAERAFEPGAAERAFEPPGAEPGAAEQAAAEPDGGVQAAGGPAAAAAVVPMQRRRGRHIAWLAAAAVVVGVMVVALVGPSVMPGGDGPEPKIGSAVAAEALSQAASKTGDVVLQPGQFLYVRSRTITGASGDGGLDPVKWYYTTDETYETWIPADQGQLWEHKRTSSGVKKFLKGSAADLPKGIQIEVLGDWKARGGNFFGDQAVNFWHPTPAYLAALPRDPKQLYVKLRAEAAGNEGDILLGEIGAGLETGLISADLRKAVFQALAYLPTLKVVGTATDLDGRQGEAFGLVVDSQLHEMIIDTATGEYLGARTVLVNDWHGIKAGTVLGGSTLTSKVVGAMGQR
ncbi:CU044_5270 family protein [Kutzneria sp. NPDC051319]|uniref:CU044_5270 family protein n=1 Tax=Kutzneria sp. NPDC051319 TaxID=3155047 RepID=UPI003438384C